MLALFLILNIVTAPCTKFKQSQRMDIIFRRFKIILPLFLFLNIIADPCSGFECIEMSTCAIDGPVCACNQGYLPMITDDGICTSK